MQQAFLGGSQQALPYSCARQTSAYVAKNAKSGLHHLRASHILIKTWHRNVDSLAPKKKKKKKK